MTSAPAPVPLSPASRHTGAWAERLAVLPAHRPDHGLGLRGGDGVLVLTAHPDDESLAAGGTLAALAAAGVRVELLCATAGEAAYVAAGLPDPGLPDRRRAELAAAADTLGLADVEVLGIPDGALTRHEDELASALADRLAGRTAVRHVLSLWRHDPHPDHAATGRAAARAARAHGLPTSAFPLWAYHWTDPATVPVVGWLSRIDPEAADRRRRAVACHASQVEPPAPGLGPVVPPEVAGWTTELVVPS